MWACIRFQCKLASLGCSSLRLAMLRTQPTMRRCHHALHQTKVEISTIHDGSISMASSIKFCVGCHYTFLKLEGDKAPPLIPNNSNGRLASPPPAPRPGPSNSSTHQRLRLF
ncbi:hypothetical protein Patl1_27938 [Pistacia atlantica]|uniref:Uncharacterized protein n=1 Tax=Pistacia atlantica TaxID=434234 RepID=A0ACC1BGZ1_9ROSI|nr:hypothetical protein Patl1_27938 [Pistacia atlantica]